MLYVIYSVKSKLIIICFIDVMVGFEQTSYRISELRNIGEICINSNSSGISAEFEINVKIKNLTGEFTYWK